MKNVSSNINNFLKHVNKERFRLMMSISFLALLLIITTLLAPTTLSKYESTTTSNANAQVAFYLLKTNYNTQAILLEEIAPRNAPYTYTFTVSNNDGTNRTETNLQYDLSIRTTTNLPLTYELYLNSVYTDANREDAITNSTVIQDDDGTYFNVFTTSTKYFSHLYDETNTYQLVVYFPSYLIDEMYQDIVESIEITVDSKQVITTQP